MSAAEEEEEAMAAKSPADGRAEESRMESETATSAAGAGGGGGGGGGGESEDEEEENVYEVEKILDMKTEDVSPAEAGFVRAERSWPRRRFLSPFPGEARKLGQDDPGRRERKRGNAMRNEKAFLSFSASLFFSLSAASTKVKEMRGVWQLRSELWTFGL